MSQAWNGLLQSLHSAVIDELVDAHPEPKPELGLPFRAARLEYPRPTVTLPVWVIPTHLDAQSGYILLAEEPGFKLALKKELPDFWEAVVRRATPEWGRRCIQPAFRPGQLCDSKALQGFLQVKVVIWTPFGLGPSQMYLGAAL